jgi:hypothetical protein
MVPAYTRLSAAFGIRAAERRPTYFDLERFKEIEEENHKEQP